MIIEDYDGHAYQVMQFYVEGKFRPQYCGAYAQNFDTWKRIKELTPKESSLVAQEDLEAYLDGIDEKALCFTR